MRRGRPSSETCSSSRIFLPHSIGSPSSAQSGSSRRNSFPSDTPHPYDTGSIRAPVFELPSVLDGPALLDKAFGRAAKATATGPNRVARARNLAATRVKVAGLAIESTLRGVGKGFPRLGRLPPVYRDPVRLLGDDN